MHLVAVNNSDTVEHLVTEIGKKYELLHDQTRTGLVRVLDQLAKLWHELPNPEPQPYDPIKIQAAIRQKLLAVWERDNFTRKPEVSIEVPPQFVLSAERLAQTDNTSPKLRQGVRLVSKKVYSELLDYLLLAARSASGEIVRSLNQGDPTRAATSSPITRFWANEILTKHDTAGVSIAFSLWQATLASVIPTRWKEQVIEQLQYPGSELPAAAINALDALFDLTNDATIEAQLLALGRWSYHPKLKMDLIEQEVDTQWRKYLQSAFWGALESNGEEQITTCIAESPLVTQTKANVTEPDLLALTLFSHKLDWPTVKAVFENTKDVHGLVINALTNDKRVKALASDSTKFNRALTRAMGQGYIPEGIDASISKQPQPFNRTIIALRRQYLRS